MIIILPIIESEAVTPLSSPIVVNAEVASTSRSRKEWELSVKRRQKVDMIIHAQLNETIAVALYTCSLLILLPRISTADRPEIAALTVDITMANVVNLQPEPVEAGAAPMNAFTSIIKIVVKVSVVNGTVKNPALREDTA